MTSRAVWRWGWRTFRREWRQQALVLGLLTVAVTATVVGTAAAVSSAPPDTTTFTLPGDDPHLAEDVAAIAERYGAVDVVRHERVPVPGSVATLDVRGHDLPAPKGRLRLLAGRLPAAASEVALTAGAARTFTAAVGGEWVATGTSRRVVGIVEDPTALADDFAVVPAAAVTTPDSVTVRLLDGGTVLSPFRLPSGTPVAVASRSAGERTEGAMIVLGLATIGLVFVALVGVAGFTVLAQRHTRVLGMLGAIGATDRQLRSAVVADGVAVGVAAAAVGSVSGLAAWFAAAPWLETSVGHRIDAWAVPWWAVLASMGLAVVASSAAAWWPARTAARVPTVTALSGRPSPPRRTRRATAAGAAAAAVGLALVVAADRRRPVLLVAGVAAAAVGTLLIAPFTIALLVRASSRVPVGMRVAVRDLDRHRGRAGAALGAVTLAVGVAVTVAVSAASALAQTSGDDVGNLAPDHVLVRAGGSVFGEAAPTLTAAETAANEEAARRVASTLGRASTVSLHVAADRSTRIVGMGGGPGGSPAAALVRVTPDGVGRAIELLGVLYLATPEVLRAAGVPASSIDDSTDLVTSRTDVSGLEIGLGLRTLAPKVQHVALPRHTSGLHTLITEQAAARLNLERTPVAWLVDTESPPTVAQVDAARRSAAAAGLTVEARDQRSGLRRLEVGATVVGVLLALGVLAMTVGLVRSESAADVRVLVANGAGPGTLRTITAATAGALGALGAALGTAMAYAGLAAFHRGDLGALASVPLVPLAAILVGLPVVAVVVAAALGGREPLAT